MSTRTFKIWRGVSQGGEFNAGAPAKRLSFKPRDQVLWTQARRYWGRRCILREVNSVPLRSPLRDG